MQFLVAPIRRWLQARRARRISLSHARTRVRRGATYLDDVDPGWHRRVDPDTLELSSGSSCILGQLHGDFRMGLSRSHLINMSSAPQASLSPVSYGFQCVRGVDDAAQDRDYAWLNRAWQEAVRARQAADPAPDGVAAGAGPPVDDRHPRRRERPTSPAAAARS